MLIFTFSLGTLALFFQAILNLQGIFLPYAPWIALVLMKCPLPKALWLSAISGVFLDLLSDHPIGLQAVNYAVTAAVLARFAKQFSIESPFHLALYSAAISFVSTWLHLFLLFLFDRRVPFAGKWAFGDFLGMPILDGVYALLWFALPLFLATHLRRYWMVFWLKRKNLSPT